VHKIEKEMLSATRNSGKLSERSRTETVSTVNSPSAADQIRERGPCPRVRTRADSGVHAHNRPATGMTFREESIGTTPPLRLFSRV